MTIELWCQYSTLDKQWCYQLVSTGQPGTYFLQWVWFYTGKFLARFYFPSTDIYLYPYVFTWSEGNRRLGRWGDSWDARQIAKWIVAAIRKHEAKIIKKALRKRIKEVK